MDIEFTLSYGFKTFSGRIGAAVLTVEADSIDEVKQRAFSIVYGSIDEEDREDICNLSISVNQKT